MYKNGIGGRFLLLAGLVAVVNTTCYAQQIQVSGANRTIAVTTSEDAERRADTAVVHIGYQLYAPTSTQVNQQAASTSKAVVDALVSAGIRKEAIESESQGTGFVQNYPNNGLTPEEHAQRKFQAQQSWMVRVAGEDASRILAAAVGAGANQSGAIEWSVADEASLSAEAAGKALRHAHEIADQMAAGLGTKLGALVYASNEAQQLRVGPRLGTATAMLGAGVGGGLGGSTMPALNLSAPMVRRSATVSAVFSIQ